MRPKRGSLMAISIKNIEAGLKLGRLSRLVGKSMTATLIDLLDAKLVELYAKKKRERRSKRGGEAIKRVD
jgi:hypothetical protein